MRRGPEKLRGIMEIKLNENDIEVLEAYIKKTATKSPMWYTIKKILKQAKGS
jgi:hypothetical protein